MHVCVSMNACMTLCECVLARHCLSVCLHMQLNVPNRVTHMDYNVIYLILVTKNAGPTMCEIPFIAR